MGSYVYYTILNQFSSTFGETLPCTHATVAYVKVY